MLGRIGQPVLRLFYNDVCSRKIVKMISIKETQGSHLLPSRQTDPVISLEAKRT